jgi:hypothetical protein
MVERHGSVDEARVGSTQELLVLATSEVVTFETFHGP